MKLKWMISLLFILVTFAIIFEGELGTSFFSSQEYPPNLLATNGLYCQNDHLLPRLFILGCMKCSTATLYDDLLLFGEEAIQSGGTIFKPRGVKEKHFFDIGFDKGIDYYSKSFVKCSSKKNQTTSKFISVDATPGYIRHPSTPLHLTSTYSPEMIKKSLFVVVLRDPTSRLFSQFNHDKIHHKHSKNISTFESYFNRQLSAYQRCQNKQMDENSYSNCYRASTSPLMGGMYDDQLLNWINRAGVPSSSFLILSFKQYTSSGQARLQVLERIFQKLGYHSLSNNIKTKMKKMGKGHVRRPPNKKSSQKSHDFMGSDIKHQVDEFYSQHKNKTIQIIQNYRIDSIPPLYEGNYNINYGDDQISSDFW